MRALSGDARSELLYDPRGGGMLGDVPVHDSTHAHLEHEEDVQQGNRAVTVTKKAQASTSRA